MVRSLVIMLCLLGLVVGVAADDIDAKGIIVDTDGFTLGYAVDGRGMDRILFLGPKLYEVTEAIKVKPYATVATNVWFSDILDELSIDARNGQAKYTAGIMLEWKAVKLSDRAWVNLYAGADCDVDNIFNVSIKDISLFPGVGVTYRVDF